MGRAEPQARRASRGSLKRRVRWNRYVEVAQCIAVAEDGRGGDVRFLGEIDTTEAATRKLVTKLATKYRQLTFCYEAGPTGYGLYWLIRKLGHDCIVVA